LSACRLPQLTVDELEPDREPGREPGAVGHDDRIVFSRR
jgi:hypothetical protein